MRGEEQDYRPRSDECQTQRASEASSSSGVRARLCSRAQRRWPTCTDVGTRTGLAVLGRRRRSPSTLTAALFDQAPRFAFGRRQTGSQPAHLPNVRADRRRRARTSRSGASWSLNTRSNSASAAAPAPRRGTDRRPCAPAAAWPAFGCSSTRGQLLRSSRRCAPGSHAVAYWKYIGHHGVGDRHQLAELLGAAARRSRRSCRATSTSSARRRARRAAASSARSAALAPRAPAGGGPRAG